MDTVPPRRPIPASVGPFRIEGFLGQGGMGTVYAGEDPDGRRVAIKLIRDDLAADPLLRKRFRREIAAASVVDGPGVARVVASDPDAETPWIATEYIEGPTLRRFVSEQGPLSGIELRRLGADLLSALRDIHASEVVHRDLTPNNVILGPNGPKVVDFGIARLSGMTTMTSHGEALGTPAWMSPEQAKGDPATPASDVFAWGAVMAFAATGRQPFSGDAPAAQLYQVVHEPPRLDGLDDQTREILSLAMRKDPAQRPDLQALWGALHGHVPRESRRSRAQAAAVLGVALITAATAIGAWTLRGPPAERSSATASAEPPSEDAFDPDLAPTLASAPWDASPVDAPEPLAALVDDARAGEPLGPFGCQLILPTELEDAGLTENPAARGFFPIGKFTASWERGSDVATLEIWPRDGTNGNLDAFFEPEIVALEYADGSMVLEHGSDRLVAIPGNDCYYVLLGFGDLNRAAADSFLLSMRRIAPTNSNSTTPQHGDVRLTANTVEPVALFSSDSVTIARLSEDLGEPTSDSGLVPDGSFGICGYADVRRVSWGRLSAFFGYGLGGDLGTFFGYVYGPFPTEEDPGQPVIYTDTGFTIGSSAEEITTLDPSIRVLSGDDIEGAVWRSTAAPGFSGTLSGDLTVRSIANLPCAD